MYLLEYLNEYSTFCSGFCSLVWKFTNQSTYSVPNPPQQASAGQSNNRRARLKSASGEEAEAHCGTTVFSTISELRIIQGSGISLRVVNFKGL